MPLGKGHPPAQFQQDLFQQVLPLPKTLQDALASDVLGVMAVLEVHSVFAMHAPGQGCRCRLRSSVGRVWPAPGHAGVIFCKGLGGSG